MIHTSPTPVPAPGGNLLTLRILWAAMLLGQLAFLAVVIVLLTTGAMGAPVDEQIGRMLLFAAFAVLAAAISGGLMVRALLFRRGRQAGEGAVRPADYFAGTLAFLAACEGAGLFGIVVILVRAQMWPAIIVVAIALAAQAISFPTGAPLREAGVGSGSS